MGFHCGAIASPSLIRFAVVGISIGPHKTSGQVCVTDFEAAYVDDEQVSEITSYSTVQLNKVTRVSLNI
jgi:hypothetical protein